MGQFRVTITAVGGHGCGREVKDGGRLQPCNRIGCPDCETRQFVKRLKEQGSNVESALLQHWPGQANEVVDDLLAGTRKGSF